MVANCLFIKGFIYTSYDPTGNPSSDISALVNDARLRQTSNDFLLDPLTQTANCLTHVPFLQELQTNVVRTYGIDPSQDHSFCMNKFGNAGIYVFADLTTPGFGISTTNPVWNSGLYNRYASVIDAMHGYPNLLGFIVGENVVTGIGPNDPDSGPFVKAAVRDMKAYIRQKRYRAIPVGYIDCSHNSMAPSLANDAISIYLNCGSRSDTVDFWGLNIMDNPTSYQPNMADHISSEENKIRSLSNYAVPVFMASYSWYLASAPNSSRAKSLYGEMSQSWSGGLIYEFMGLKGIFNSSFTPSPASKQISSQMAQISPFSTDLVKYTPTNTAAACPIGAAISLPPNPTAPVPPISPQNVTNTNSQNVSSHELSRRGKLSIGITVPTSVLILGAVLFCLKARKKKRGLQQQDSDVPWARKELAADDIDPEARGYGPHMPASTERAELEDTGIVREVPTEGNQILEAPGDILALPEPLYTSFEEELLTRFCELVA